MLTRAKHLKAFWPIQSWSSSRLVVVLDAESSEDHRVGTILSNLNLISRIQVKYEAMPPSGTTCSDWRKEGYARQQYSNFYADLYTDADFVAIVDTDAEFITAGKSTVQYTETFCIPPWSSFTKRRGIPQGRA